MPPSHPTSNTGRHSLKHALSATQAATVSKFPTAPNPDWCSRQGIATALAIVIFSRRKKARGGSAPKANRSATKARKNATTRHHSATKAQESTTKATKSNTKAKKRTTAINTKFASPALQARRSA
jgi:hypothetical protein